METRCAPRAPRWHLVTSVLLIVLVIAMPPVIALSVIVLQVGITIGALVLLVVRGRAADKA
ncbi:MAG: hypothetical protein K2Y23_08525 [Cyanobacteria bacterium]|nr:hypothetical protein [Cyanobacteriota bacterium]